MKRKKNLSADAFSRICGATVQFHANKSASQLHNDLCHPGVQRMLHFVRSKNLPFSTEEVRNACNQCRSCSELKPRFYKPELGTIIKATSPFERISIDFVGPKPSNTRNKYLLTVIDEYSRFPFAFPTPDTSSSTVIKCLAELFSIFGQPSYVHSDRGSHFMSTEFREWLARHGIAQSRTSPYNPMGNGQNEKYNGVLWKAIQLTLHEKSLEVNQWEHLLPQALHSIRSLLCTATNQTPHERLFSFPRRSPNGTSLPTWLTIPGPILVRRHNRSSKSEPLVDHAELILANPNYAIIKKPDGNETTVSLRDLAPCPKPDIEDHGVMADETEHQELDTIAEGHEPTFKFESSAQSSTTDNPTEVTKSQRPQRTRKVPLRYQN